ASRHPQLLSASAGAPFGPAAEASDATLPVAGAPPCADPLLPPSPRGAPPAFTAPAPPLWFEPPAPATPLPPPEAVAPLVPDASDAPPLPPVLPPASLRPAPPSGTGFGGISSTSVSVNSSVGPVLYCCRSEE